VSEARNIGRRFGGLALVVVGAAAAVAFGLGPGRLTFGPPVVMLGIGGATLALAALALYRTLDPLVRPDVGRAESPQAPARRRELERDKQAVLKAIREIDLDFQMRKISEADHRELTNRYRARALRIIRELDAGDDFRTLIEQELKSRIAATDEAKK
jgi:hypothetical protein